MKCDGKVKKIISLCAVLSVSSTLQAGNGAPYVGLQLGANTGGSWNLVNPAGRSTYFGTSGESIGILGGYGKLFGARWYLGGEGFWNDSVTRTATKNTDTIGTTVKMRTTYSYGASILPGFYIVSDTMLFARLGVIRTRFELTESIAAQSSSQTSDNTATGGQVGVWV